MCLSDYHEIVTTKQKAFCKHYINAGFNASEAARRAGYSETGINVTGSRLLANPNINAEIKKIVHSELSNLDGAALRLLKTLTRAAYFDPRKVVTWGPDGINLLDSDELEETDAMMVTEVSETVTKDGGSTRVKFASKEKAWEMLAKFSRLIDDTRQENTDNDAGSMTKDKKERLSFLLKKRT